MARKIHLSLGENPAKNFVLNYVEDIAKALCSQYLNFHSFEEYDRDHLSL